MNTYNFEKLTKQDWLNMVSESMNFAAPEAKLSKITVDEITYPALEMAAPRVANLATFPDEITHLPYKELSKRTHWDVIESWNKSGSSWDQILQEASSKNEISLNGGILHNSGASVIDELTMVLSLALQFPNKKLRFIHAASSKQYLTMAKLRGLRFIWERICEENSLKSNFEILAMPSLREFTLYDEHNNTLRSCVGVLGAMLGGANIISVIGHDRLISHYNKEDSSDNGLRLAANVFHILEEESHLTKVKDPAKGSFAIENLTWQIIDKVTARLAENESDDFKSYWQSIPEKVAKTASQRYLEIQKAKNIITGINSFSNTQQRFLHNDAEVKYYDGGEGYFPLRRLASEFESLRIGFEKISSKLNGVIYCFGDRKKLGARINFCKNYFEVAGISMHEHFSHDEDLENQLSKADLVVFCAEDDDYNKFLEQSEKVKKFTSNIFVAGKVSNEIIGNHPVVPIYKGQNIFEVLKNLMRELMK